VTAPSNSSLAADLALAGIDVAEREVAVLGDPDVADADFVDADFADADFVDAELAGPEFVDEVADPEVAGAEAAGASVAGELPDDDNDALPDSGRPSHLRVAPEIERGLLHRRRRAQLVVLGVAALSAASMFLLVTFHVFAAQSAFALDKLDTQVTSQQREYGLLRDKVATLSSPDAVATGAKRLGMVRSTDVTQLHPLSAPSFATAGSLPVPPLTPYRAIDDTGQ
jgi:cell division protein FtsL